MRKEEDGRQVRERVLLLRGQSTYKGMAVWKNRMCSRRLIPKPGVKRRLGKKSRTSKGRAWGQWPRAGCKLSSMPAKEQQTFPLATRGRHRRDQQKKDSLST